MERFSEELLEKCIGLLRSWHIPLPEVRRLCDTYSPVIKVDRRSKLVYPEFPDNQQMTLLTPHLEEKGPLEFDITKLEQWFIPEQEELIPSGDTFYESVRKNTLESCLGLRELQAIASRGPHFFKNHIGQHGGLYAYKGAARDAEGILHVPCACFSRGSRTRDGIDKVIIVWWRMQVQPAKMPVYRLPQM